MKAKPIRLYTAESETLAVAARKEAAATPLPEQEAENFKRLLELNKKIFSRGGTASG